MHVKPWWDIGTLRERLPAGPEARLLGYWAGPDQTAPNLAFLAANVRGVMRSLVALGPDLMVRFVCGPEHPPTLEVSGGKPDERIRAVDIDGVRLGSRVIAFHNEPVSARSAVSFPAGHGSMLEFLVTGLAPGEWQVWRNGWLQDIAGQVSPRAGCLFFEGQLGSYFLRRLG